MKKVLLPLLASAFALPLAAHAEGFYFGANVGRAEQKLNIEGLDSLKDTATGFKLYGGRAFTKNFGVEVGYVNFGKGGLSVTDGVDTLSASVKPQSLYAAATGSLPLNNEFSLFAKVGVSANRTKLTATVNGVSESESSHTTSAMFGIGAEYSLSKTLSLVGEYENFGKVAKEDGVNLKADLISVGLRYKF